MPRRGVFTVLALLAFLAGAPIFARQATTGRTLDARMIAVLDRHHGPDAVAIVVTPSRTLYREAFGVADLSTRREMAPDAIFRIASMTKPVTSVAARQLVERGRIGLDDPASRYLPEFKELAVFESFNPANGD